MLVSLPNTLESTVEIISGFKYVTVSSLVQSQKAEFPKLVTSEGIVMDVRALHLQKQNISKILTLDGIVMDFRLLHS